MCAHTHLHTRQSTVLCVLSGNSMLKSDVFVLFSDFNSKSLQADWLFRKTSAAMVQETKEPGQTQFAQKVSRGQVNRHTHTICTHFYRAMEQVEAAAQPCVPPAIWARTSPLFLTRTHYNATLLLPGLQSTLFSHTRIQPSTRSLAQGPSNRGSVTTVGYFYVWALIVAEAKPTAWSLDNTRLLKLACISCQGSHRWHTVVTDDTEKWCS